jgi:hypothetical protein
MKRAIWLTVMGLAWGTAFPSCIFQNDPVRPNSPPTITFAFPDELVLVMQAPTDTIRFTLEAGDPDLDEITYRWVFLDRDGNVESTVVTGDNSYTFDPVIGGFYHIQGRAHDRVDYAAHDWYVTVIEEHNEPPEIVWRAPDQDSISVLIGNSLEFRMGVEDDHPEDLRYTYYVGAERIEYLDPTPDISYRFMQNGIFDVRGIVTDGEFADTTRWAVRVTGEPDTIAPGPITDLRGWTGSEPGTVLLRWTAPGDDGNEGTARYYRVRTHTIPIFTEDEWDDASQKNGVPVPGPSGTVETMTAVNLNPGTWLYVTARAVDDFGNMSELGNCIRLLVRGIDADGLVYDAQTGLPVGGVVVSAEGIQDTTGADGRYLLRDLPLYADLIRVRDEHIVGDLGDYYDLAWNLHDLEWHFTLDLPLLPAFGLENELSNTYGGDFLEFLKYLTETRGLMGRPTIWKNWNHYPVSVYNPPFTWEGVDIQAIAAQAMQEWEERTGLDLFVDSSDSSTADVVITYNLEDNSKHHVETIASNPDGTPLKKEIWIFPINTLSPINIKGLMIFCHEFGHVLNLSHSYDLGHLMVGFTAPITSVPTTDEVRLVQVLNHYPIIFDTSQILKE